MKRKNKLIENIKKQSQVFTRLTQEPELPPDVENDPEKKRKMRRIITKAALDLSAFNVNDLEELDDTTQSVQASSSSISSYKSSSLVTDSISGELLESESPMPFISKKTMISKRTISVANSPGFAPDRSPALPKKKLLLKHRHAT